MSDNIYQEYLQLIGEEVPEAQADIPTFDPSVQAQVHTEDGKVYQSPVNDFISRPDFQNASVNVFNKSNKLVSVQVKDIPKALQQGYRLETPREAELRQGADALDDRFGAAAPLLVAGAKIANQGFFGVPEILSPNTPEEEEFYNRHQTASTIGNVIGVGANIVGTAGLGAFGQVAKLGNAARAAVGARAGTGLAAQVLAHAAGGAAEGLALSAPQAAAHLVMGDTEAAAESALAGFGIGGVLGAGGHLLGEGISKAVQFGEQKLPGYLAQQAEQRAWKSLEPLAPHAREAQRVLGGGAGEQSVGRTILNQDLGRDVSLLPFKGEEFGDYAKRIAARKEVIGQEIGQAYKDLDNLGVPTGLTAGDLISRLEQETLVPLRQQAGHKAEARAVEREINNFRDLLAADAPSGNLSFEQLHRYQKDFGDKAFRFGKLNPSPIEAELQSFRKIIKEELQTKGEALDSQFGGKIKELNTTYRNLSIAETAANDYASRELKNRSVSLTDYITGTTGGAVFGPIGSIVGPYVNKKLREDSNIFAAKVLDKLSKHIAKNGIIPQAVDDFFASSTVRGTVKDAAINPVDQFIASKNKDKKVKLNEMSSVIAKIVANPEKRADIIGNVMHQFNQAGLDEVGALYANKLNTALDYMNKSMPKQFAPYPMYSNRTYKAPDNEMRAFEQKLEVINDPLVVLKRLKDLTLSANHVDAIKAVYPDLYKKITAALLEQVGKQNNLSLQQKSKLSLLLGNDVTGLKPTVPTNTNARPPIAAGMPVKAKPQANIPLPGFQQAKPIKGNIALPSLQTDTQRISTKVGR